MRYTLDTKAHEQLNSRQASAESASSFDALQNLSFQPIEQAPRLHETIDREPVQKTTRRERKLAAIILTGDLDVLNQPQVDMTDELYHEALEKNRPGFQF